MHIIYYHQYFSTSEGSAGVRSHKMAQELISRGHEITMVCASAEITCTGLSGPFVKGKREGFVDRIRVIEFELPYSNKHNLMKRSVTFVKFAIRSTVLALTEKYDLLFATSTPLTAGIPGIFASLLRRKKFVFEVRDLWPELPREMGVVKNPLVLKALDILEWLSYRTSCSCIGLSPGIVQGIIRRNVSPERVKMIPNGCDLDLFTLNSGEDLRPEGVEKKDFLAVFCGAHGIANGLDAVLDACAELKRRQRWDIKVAMIGAGKLKPQLIARADQEGLSNCLFLDLMPRSKLVAYLRGANAGLMILANIPAFYYGTSPNKFFDYISMGLPVINNYPGWLADMITEHRCGIAVPPEEPAAFADALERMADNQDLTKEMGAKARLLAEKSFSRQHLAAEFADWLEKSVSAPN